MLEESASAIPSSLWASMNSWFTPTVLFVLLNIMIGTIVFTSSSSGKKQQQKQSQSDFNHPSHLSRSPSVLQRLKSVNFYSHFRSQEQPLDREIHQKQVPDSDASFSSFQAQEHYFFQHNSNQEINETVHQSTPENHYSFEHNPRESQIGSDLEGKESRKESIDGDDFRMIREGEEENEDEIEQNMDEIYSQLSANHVSRTNSDMKPSAGEIPTKLAKKMRKSATMKSSFGHFEEEEIVEARRPATAKENGSAKAADADEGVDAKADDFINRFKQQLKLQRLDSIIRYKDMVGRGSG